MSYEDIFFTPDGFKPNSHSLVFTRQRCFDGLKHSALNLHPSKLNKSSFLSQGGLRVTPGFGLLLATVLVQQLLISVHALNIKIFNCSLLQYIIANCQKLTSTVISTQKPRHKIYTILVAKKLGTDNQ